jgi:hypothetical protein
VDSYDSTKPNIKSDQYGQWDPTDANGDGQPDKRQKHGDVATNGTLIEAGSAHIYGNVSTNEGVSLNTSNVTGEVRDDFATSFDTIYAPNTVLKSSKFGTNWPKVTSNQNPTYIDGTGNRKSLAATTTKGDSQYQLDYINLNNTRLTISGQGRASNTEPVYVDVYVTGDVSVTGNGDILLEDNVFVTMYVAGNITLTGNGVGNANKAQNDRPSHFLIYSIAQTDPVTGKPIPDATPKQVSISGNGSVEAMVYAPDADIIMNGGGNMGDFSGSVVGNTVKFNGNTRFHYDESLNTAGFVSDYKISSWFEDTARDNLTNSVNVSNN